MSNAQFPNTTKVGNGPYGTITTNGPGSYTILGGGYDIWSDNDEFTFHYAEITGDFDLKVRVDSVEVTATWPKAGIMARESMNPDSRYAFIKVSPAGPIITGGGNGIADVKFMYRTWIRGSTGGNSGGEHEDGVGGSSYPAYKWVRLQRVGNVFSSYASMDGVTWVGPTSQDTVNWRDNYNDAGAPTRAFNATAYVGLAHSRHGSATLIHSKGEFREFGDVTLVNAPTITQQPASVTQNAGLTATFSVRATSGGFYTEAPGNYVYQWYVNGFPIADATNATYTTGPLTTADNGAYTVGVTNVIGGVVSDAATLTVQEGPALFAVTSIGNPATIYAFFQRDMDPTTALDTTKYAVDNGINVTGAAFNTALASNGPQSVVELQLDAALVPGTVYTLTVTGVQDNAAKTIYPNPSTKTFSQLNGVAYDFNSGQPAGTIIAHNAQVFPSGIVSDSPVLKMTHNANDSIGTIVVNELAPGVPMNQILVSQFTASFDSRVIAGSGNPADGWSFNFANNLPDGPEILFANIGVEGGVGSGLSVCFFYYNNDRIEVKYGGVSKGSVDLPGDNQIYGRDSFTRCTINVDPDGTLDLTWGGQIIFTNLQTGFTPMKGRFGIYGRTGGENAQQYLDNITIGNLYTPGPLAFAAEPVSQTVQGPNRVTFTAQAAGTQPFFYQWYSNDVAIAGATGSSYSIYPTLFDNDNGDQYRVEVRNLTAFIASSNAVLTVIPDEVAPTLVSALGSGSPCTSFRLYFSEIMEKSTVEDFFGYSFSDGNNIVSIVLNADGISADFVVQNPIANGTMLYAQSKLDLSYNPIPDDSAVAIVVTEGLISRWQYGSQLAVDAGTAGSYRIEGGAVSDLTGNGNFPNNPWVSETRTLFEQAVGADGDANFGAWMAGYLTPELSGTYYFGISSDDASQLWLSTDENPANRVMIAQQTGWNSSREYPNKSGPINLVAGKRYFIQAYMKEGGGGDNLAVAWNTTSSIPNGTEPISGRYLDPFRMPAITQQPVNATVTECNPATFSVDYFSPPTVPTIQWYDSVIGPIPGATGKSYTTPWLYLADNGRQYWAVITHPGGTVTSAQATVTVNADPTPLALISASTLDGFTLGALFNKRLDPTSAQNVANYSVPGANVTNVWLRPDGKTVVISLDLPVSPFTLTVSGIKDCSGIVDLGPNTTASGQIWASAQDIFDPTLTLTNILRPTPGTNFTWDTGSIEITAGGYDIWDTHDEFRFVYNVVVGDFDVRALVSRLDTTPDGGSRWAKAGLMARTSLEATYPTIQLNTCPLDYPNSAQVEIETGVRETVLGGTGGWETWRPNTANTPGLMRANAWVRLKRIGDMFIGYYSKDGVNWFEFARRDYTGSGLPAASFVGMAFTSHAAGYSSTAVFEHYGQYTIPGCTVNITKQPADATIDQGRTVRLSVEAYAAGARADELLYQWQRNDGSGTFTNLPTAKSASYTTPALALEDSGAEFKVIVSAPGCDATSRTAVITVQEDKTAPHVVTAWATSPTNVMVFFSEAMDPATAGDASLWNDPDPKYTAVMAAEVSTNNPSRVKLTLLEGFTLEHGNTYLFLASYMLDAYANELVPNPTEVSVVVNTNRFVDPDSMRALPEDTALPLDSLTARGFDCRIVQLYLPSADIPNDNNIAELILSGRYGAGANTAGRPCYIENGVINYNWEGTSYGHLLPDKPIPGIPNPAYPSTDDFVFEALCYVPLQPGNYRWGVNSDDGFRVTPATSASDPNNAIILGEFNGGRGTSDTVFEFFVTKPGLYPIRLTWEEGNGGANCEFWSINPDTGAYIGLNETAGGGLPVYRVMGVNAPTVTIVRETNGDVTLTWPAYKGSSCNLDKVQGTLDVGTSPVVWTTLPVAITTSASGVNTATVPAAFVTGNAFFRVIR